MPHFFLPRLVHSWRSCTAVYRCSLGIDLCTCPMLCQAVSDFCLWQSWSPDLSSFMCLHSLPMDFEASWQQLNEEPALQSTGWDTEMEMLPAAPTAEAAASISVPLASPLEAVMAIPVPAKVPAPAPASKPASTKSSKAEHQDEHLLPTCPSTQVWIVDA